MVCVEDQRKKIVLEKQTFVEKHLNGLKEETSKLADTFTAALLIYEEHMRDNHAIRLGWRTSPTILQERGGCTLAMFWNGNRLSERKWRRSRGFQWPAAERAQACCQRCGTNSCVKVFGLIGTRGIVCVYTQLPRIEMFRRSMGRMASSSSSFRKNRWSSVSW